MHYKAGPTLRNRESHIKTIARSKCRELDAPVTPVGVCWHCNYISGPELSPAFSLWHFLSQLSHNPSVPTSRHQPFDPRPHAQLARGHRFAGCPLAAAIVLRGRKIQLQNIMLPPNICAPTGSSQANIRLS